MKSSTRRVGQHFQKMKAKAAKPKSDQMHVVNLPPKVADIFTQMAKPRHFGICVSLRCPYCQNLNIEGQPLCCDDFRQAIVMIRDTQPVPVMVN